METNFNFKSQIATDKNQSERLLALGLKPETADMVWTHAYYGTWVVTASENPLYEESESVPAWSLGRLIEMLQHCQYEGKQDGIFVHIYCPFLQLISSIEHLIRIGKFNKEYLEERYVNNENM